MHHSDISKDQTPKPPISKPLAAGAGSFLTSRSRRRLSIGSKPSARLGLNRSRNVGFWKKI
jgi:hypothetical protein